VCVTAAGVDRLRPGSCQHHLGALSDSSVHTHHSRRDSLLHSRPFLRLLTGTTTRSQAVARIADRTAAQQIDYLVISDCC